MSEIEEGPTGAQDESADARPHDDWLAEQVRLIDLEDGFAA